MKSFIFAAAAAMIPYVAVAHDGMAVKDAYARGANPKSGAAFMLLENHRKVDCTLKGVASDAAERVELHSSAEVDGVMKMQPIKDGIIIPAGGEYLLKRGSQHVMLMGLHDPLQDGTSINMALDFGECGIENVEVPVDNQRAGGSHSDDHGSHNGHDDHKSH